MTGSSRPDDRAVRESARESPAGSNPKSSAVPEESLAARRAWGLVTLLVILAATGVRIWAARDDFWLDEIWSLMLAGSFSSPLDVFTRVHLDNNHYLVTLWMYACGFQRNWLIYRIPSILAGVGTVTLAAGFSRQWGERAAFVSALFTGASFVLIEYASEARGYALAGFFALAALWSLQRFLATGSVWANLTFCAAVILGFLSHLSFLHFYLGAIVWSLVSLAKSKRSWSGAFAGLTRCHLVPVCFLGALYAVDVSRMRIGGGDPYVLTDVLAETLALAIGSPAAGPLEILSGCLAFIAALVALFLLWRERSDLWIVFAVTIIGSPAALLMLRRPEVLYVRYFYINIVFFLVLCGYLFGRLLQGTVACRCVAVAGVAAIMSGNLWLTAQFLRGTRGHYREALEYMAAHSVGSSIDVASDHDFRNKLPLLYYASSLPPGCALDYRERKTPRPTPPEWFIIHSQSAQFAPPEVLRDQNGNEYARERVFPFFGLSGFHWALYHRAEKKA